MIPDLSQYLGKADLGKAVIGFFLGVFSARLLEFIKIRKIQKNITAFYNESVGEFQQAVNTIDREDGEEKYLSIKEKLSLAKSNLQMLLSYSWAIERLKPKYFFQLQKKYNLIQEIDKSPPFNGRNHWSVNLDFLRRYKEEITTEHKIFNKYLSDLKIV